MINNSYAQEPVIDLDVEKQLVNIDKGPATQKKLIFTTTDYGLHFSSLYDNDSIRAKSGSFTFHAGYTIFHRITNKVRIGYNIDYAYDSFGIRQDSAKNLLSLGYENDKQRLAFSQLKLGPALRFNIGKTGNKIGKYIETGGFFGHTFASSIWTKNKVDPTLNNGGEILESKLKKLDYLNRLSYGLNLRVGLNTVNLWFQYRLSSIFVPSDNIYNGNVLPELPRLSLGIGFSFLNN